jgi:hypothetical protein
MDNVMLLLRAPGQPEQVLERIVPYYRPARISHSYSILLDESTVFSLDVRTGRTLYKCTATRLYVRTGGIVTIKARGNAVGGPAAWLMEGIPLQVDAWMKTRRRQD